MSRKTYYNLGKETELSDHAPREAVRREFARRLQKLMVAKGWNQSEMARQSALHMPDKSFGRDLISGYLRGRFMPGPVHLNAIARAAGVPPDELVPTRSTTAAAMPPRELRDMGGGMCWLSVNQVVSWQTALQIMRLLQEGENAAESA